MTSKDRLKCTVSCLVAMVVPSALTSLAALCQKHRTPNEISMEALVMLVGGPFVITSLLAIDLCYTAVTRNQQTHPFVRALLTFSAVLLQIYLIPPVGKNILKSDVDEIKVRTDYSFAILIAAFAWFFAKAIAYCNEIELPQIFHFPSDYVPRVQQEPLITNQSYQLMRNNSC